jgi:RNA polymerase sigma-70 factor (ECF subfamily)
MTDHGVPIQAPPEPAVTAASPATSARPPTFQEIFRAEFSYVCWTLRRLGVRERDLEDVAHDVFIVVHARLVEYDPARPLRPWLFAFAYRVAGNYRRAARHARELLDDADTTEGAADDRPAPDEVAAAAQARALVIRALDAIEIDRRAVFVMHELDGCPIPEVAATLGIPLNTAYSRLRLAREEFHAAVQRATRGAARVRHA